MLDPIADTVKVFMVPGFPVFLLLVATGVVVLSFGSHRRRSLAIRLLAVIVLGYWLLSIPAISDWLASVPFSSGVRQTDTAGVRAIVVLSSGARAVNVGDDHLGLPMLQTTLNSIEGARLYRRLGHVPVIVSGGIASGEVGQITESGVLRDLLVSLGVPATSILLESQSRTTHEQAVFVAPLIRERHLDPFLLVTSPAQLLRAVPTFRKLGVNPVAAPAPFRSEACPSCRWWKPSTEALASSQRSLHDYVGWVYYRMRDWL